MEIFPGIYASVIDPLLLGFRKIIQDQIPQDSEVIDIACGTGAQSFLLAGKCKRIAGIDISESMVRYAETRRQKLKIGNLSFLVSDASKLDKFSDNEFKFSIMTLALHQFPPGSVIDILREASRVSEKIVITDYAVPQPGNIYGFLINLIERIAGKDHYGSFKNYLSSGGMVPLCRDAGLKLISMKKSGRNLFEMGVFGC